MIEIIDKHKAKLIVNMGSGKKRKRRTKTVTYERKRDLPKMYVDFERECLRKQVRLLCRITSIRSRPTTICLMFHCMT